MLKENDPEGWHSNMRFWSEPDRAAPSCAYGGDACHHRSRLDDCRFDRIGVGHSAHYALSERTGTGSPLQPRSLTHVVSAFLKEWGGTLHKLRHSHASHMLASNVHPKIVRNRLGHSSIAITMDIYSHLMPNIQGEAAAVV